MKTRIVSYSKEMFEYFNSLNLVSSLIMLINNKIRKIRNNPLHWGSKELGALCVSTSFFQVFWLYKVGEAYIFLKFFSKLFPRKAKRGKMHAFCFHCRTFVN